MGSSQWLELVAHTELNVKYSEYFLLMTVIHVQVFQCDIKTDFLKSTYVSTVYAPSNSKAHRNRLHAAS